MDSPFPGMNPFLEDPAFWGDFHHTFIGAWREHIADLLPSRYEARVDERFYLVKMPMETRKLADPDIAIVKRAKRKHGKLVGTSGASTLVPVSNRILVEEHREGYIKILRRPQRKLVAVLELLSPANKKLPGRKSYLKKRIEVLHQKTHLVELDLLLQGRRMPLAEAPPAGDYYYVVSDFRTRPKCEVYCWTMRQPFPVVPIPLLGSDQPIFCDLSAAFATAFQRGRYGEDLEYRNNPRVRLPAEDLRWAKEQIRAARVNG